LFSSQSEYDIDTYIKHTFGHVGVCHGEVWLTDRLYIHTQRDH